MDDEAKAEQEAFVTQEDPFDDDMLEILAAEIDEDAILIMQFEDSIGETIQSDSELSEFYSTYQDARRRLNEPVKVRGFWPVSRRFDKGAGKKGRGKGKGRCSFAGPGSLGKRIAFKRDIGKMNALSRERPAQMHPPPAPPTALPQPLW